MQVTVSITGNAEDQAAFQKLGDKLTDFGPAMKILGNELVDFYGSTDNTPGKVFGSEGGIFGTKWDDLSPVYKKYKGKHYPGRGILVRTGDLMRSFRATSDRTSVTVDNPTPYFEHLQQGTQHMPPRPMLVINDDVEKIVEDVIYDDVRRKIESVI